MNDQQRPRYYPSHDTDPDKQYRERQRNDSMRVVFWCLLGFVVIVAAAGICAAVNLSGGAK